MPPGPTCWPRLAALPGLTADRQVLRPIAPQRRLPWLLASAAAVVLMVAAAPHALLLARSDLRSSDAPRVVQLEDGSTAVLDAGTALAVEFDGQRRHLRLLRGQAWFQVAHEARPFQVEAAGGQVRDIGTAFSVSMQDTTVVTQVSEGVVDVRPGDGSVQRLHAGQARVFRDGRWLQPLRQADPDAVAPWRRGEVVIDDQPAAQAIADLARYRRAPVWVLGRAGRKRTGQWPVPPAATGDGHRCGGRAGRTARAALARRRAGAVVRCLRRSARPAR